MPSFVAVFVATVPFMLLSYLVSRGLRSRSLEAEIQFAEKLDDLDARVPVVVEKLRRRGRMVLANRISGSHKRLMFRDEFDERVRATYLKALVRHPSLAQRLFSAYGIR